MSQTIAGQTESKTDLLNQITAKIDEIEKKYGVHYIAIGSDAEEIFNLDLSTLEKLTPDECNRYMYVLAQYNIYVQKNQNRCKAIIGYLNAKLQVIIAREYSNYKANFVPPDVVKSSIIAGNDYANKLFAMIQQYNLEIESLFDLTRHVAQMSQALRQLAYRRGD